MIIAIFQLDFLCNGFIGVAALSAENTRNNIVVITEWQSRHILFCNSVNATSCMINACALAILQNDRKMGLTLTKYKLLTIGNRKKYVFGDEGKSV